MGKGVFQIEDGVLVRYSGRARTVIVPDGVRAIGEKAFASNGTMEKLILPDGLKEIGLSAFAMCDNLKTVELPDSLETIRVCAFAFCQRLASVRIPPLVTELPRHVLSHCEGLTALTLPDRLTSFGEFALCGCSSLTSIRIPPLVTELPLNLLSHCTNLEEVELPEGLKRICTFALADCQSLRELELPSTLEHIGKEALQTCGNSLRLSFPSGLAHPTPELLRALYYENLQALELPTVSILSLPPELQPAGILGLAEWEERGNTLPPELEADVMTYLSTEWLHFQSKAADNLPLLRFLTRRKVLPRESLQVLLDRVEDTGNPETTALLLDSLGRLPPPDPEEQARNLERELETGYLSEAAFDASWTAMHWDSDGLALTGYHGANRDGHIVIPAGRGEEPVTLILLDPFRDLPVRSLVIPEGVRGLGHKNFAGSEALESVSLPSTLKEISWGAFYACCALSEVRIAPGIETIRPEAFCLCISLTEMDIPEGVKRIEWSAFNRCVGLIRVSFPSTLESIREAAFMDCGSLKDVIFRSIPKEIKSDAFPYDTPFTIHVPHKVPAGPFRNWLQTMLMRACCRVVCD